MKKGLEAKVIEKRGEKTILEIEGQKITVSTNSLPDSLTASQIFKVYFLRPEEGVMAEKKLAKTILEEILNGK